MDIEKFYKDKKKYERLELVLLKDGKKPKDNEQPETVVNKESEALA